MANDEIRMNLRAALNAAVGKEKAELNRVFDGVVEGHKASVRMLSPIMRALEELQQETDGQEGIRFLIAPGGHSAFISARTSISSASVSISTNHRDEEGSCKFPWNACFIVEINICNYFSGGTTESQQRQIDNPDEVLEIVVNILARHQAQMEIIKERHRKH